MKLQWIDTHTHVSDVGQDGGIRANMLENLLDVLDRSGADLRFVISCDTPYIERIANDPSQMLASNKVIYDLVNRAQDRLYGACMINPNYLNESLRVMNTCLGEWGFVMLGEMLQYAMNYRMDSDAAEKVVRLATKYDVPVQVHLGTYWHRKAGSSGAGMDHMADLLGLVDRVPEAKYILAHAVGCGPTPDYIPWADMFLDTLAGVFPSYPRNFWIEIRDFQCRALKRAIAEVPVDRLLAGTDWTTRVGPPFQSYGTMFGVEESANPFSPKVGSLVNFLREAGASEEDVSLIAFDNARDLLKL